MVSHAARTALCVLCLVALAAPCWAATVVGGSTGTFVVHCPVDGAGVWFDKDYKGQIANGTLAVPVYVTATPYQTYQVEADNYDPFIAAITEYPSAGETVDLQANLTRSAIGGDTGTIRFVANVDGARVFLDADFQGRIENGQLLVTVYSTGTPYREYTVQAPGYLSATGPVPRMPAAGETVTIDVTLAPRGTPTGIGGDRGAFLVLCPVDGAMVSFDADYKGNITDGELLVPVYVTGTPYRTFFVNASGYRPYSAPITKYPGKGEVVTLLAFPEPIAPATTPPAIGGDIGYYLVHSNAEGGRVFFDSDYKGNVLNGLLNVSVYVTGTPYRTWSVVKEGYATFNGTITVYPQKGQTVDLQATLTLLPTASPATPSSASTTAAPAGTASPLSPVATLGALVCLSVLGFAARRR